MLLFLLFTALTIVAIFTFQPLSDIFLGDYQKYLDYKEFSDRAFLPKMIIIALVSLFIFLTKVYRDSVQKQHIYLFLLGALFVFLGLFFEQAERIAIYLMFPFMILILDGMIDRIRLISPHFTKRAILLCGIIFFIGTYYIASSSDIFPYQFVSQGGL
jgi:hypothetical protein